MSYLARNSRGFVLATAIFIMVVLAALGAFMVNISSDQHVSSGVDVQIAHAQQAARAGIEWGLYQVQASPNYNFSFGLSPAVANQANPNVRECPTPATSSFTPPAPSLASFTVTVTCTKTVDANGGPTVYRLTAIACNQPSAGTCPGTPSASYIERRLDAEL